MVAGKQGTISRKLHGIWITGPGQVDYHEEIHMRGRVSGRSTRRLPWTPREQAAHRKSYAARWRTLHMERDAQGASNCKWRGQKTTKPALAKAIPGMHKVVASSATSKWTLTTGGTVSMEKSAPILGYLQCLGVVRNLSHLVCCKTFQMEWNAEAVSDPRPRCCICRGQKTTMPSLRAKTI